MNGGGDLVNFLVFFYGDDFGWVDVDKMMDGGEVGHLLTSMELGPVRLGEE